MAKTLHINKPLTEEQINHCRMMTMRYYYEHYGIKKGYGISKGSLITYKGDDEDASQEREVQESNQF